MNGTSGNKTNKKASKWLLTFAIQCLIFCIFLYMLTACKSEKLSGKKIFAYNESTGIATLDPAFAKNQSIMWAIHQIYNTLVEIDSNLTVVPSLAKSWEISENRLTYTFHIRNNIFFQDDDAFINGKGRRMIAQDVVYSFNRILDKRVASSGGWIFNNKVVLNRPFVALNDSTFQLTLIRPFPPILGILSMKYCSIVPREVVEKQGKEFRRHPCGTGPFQFYLWEEGQAMVLHRNPHYWEKDSIGKQLPYLDAIKISFYDNKATEFLQFRQHQLSFINDIDPSFKDEVLTKNGELREVWKDKILLNKHSYLNTEYFGILMDEDNELVKNSPLRIKAVRQAINYCINRQQLMMYMRNSIGYAATAGFCPGGLPSRNIEFVKGYHYNPAKARELLRQAGFKEGADFPVIKILTINIYSDIASFVAKQCEEVGINVQVEIVQKSLLLEQTAKSEALFFRGSWIADYPDAENYMAMFYSKNPAPPNYTRYKNPSFDKLYEKALEETVDSLRYDLYRQMDQMVINDAPVVPLFYDMVIHLVNKNIIGMRPNALNLLELRKVDIRN